MWGARWRTAIDARPVGSSAAAAYIRSPMNRSSRRDPVRMLSMLAVQLEQDRRVFLLGGIGYVIANLALAGLAWLEPGGSSLGWIVPAIAFLANVFYVLIAQWEMKWEALWRREVPRLERELGDGVEVLSPIMADSADPRRIQRWLRIVSYALTTAWLLALLVAIEAAGLRFGIAG